LFRRWCINLYSQYIDPLIGPERLSPNVIILGAQKAGTTSLYHYMAEHPDILASKTKEVHFFDLNYNRGQNWYRYHFLPRTRDNEKCWCVESSPYYLYHPLVAARIKSCLPDVRFIVMLRDPVTRALSHYWHEYRRGRESLSFKDALDREQERLAGTTQALMNGEMTTSFNHQRYSYFSRGLYAQQLSHWFSYFSRDQFLILESENFFANPSSGMATLTEFLDIAPFSNIEFTRHNSGSYKEQTNPEVLDALRAAYRAPNLELAELLGCQFSWTTI